MITALASIAGLIGLAIAEYNTQAALERYVARKHEED